MSHLCFVTFKTYFLNFKFLYFKNFIRAAHTAIENFNKNSLKLSTLSSEFCKKLQLLVAIMIDAGSPVSYKHATANSIIKLVRSKNRGIVCGNFLIV